ncbi:MAG: VPLPA-CTERM sorting domain-containing protein [Methylococcales bacterium]
MKKQMKLNVLFILLIVPMFGTAHASFVGSAAQLDLELVTFTPLSGDATLELKNESNQVFVNSDGENAEASGSSDAFATSRSLGGIADAGSSPGELFASTEVDAEGNTEAFAEHSVDYMAQGTGVVKVTVDYNFLFVSSDASNQDSELFASASLSDNEANVFDEASLEVGAGDDLSLDLPGELEILLALDDGDFGTLVFNASSLADLGVSGINEVPLPPALVLFASALIGLTAVKRRKGS